MTLKHTDVIDKFFHKRGLLVKRLKNLNDIGWYQRLYGPEPVAKRLFYNVGAGIFNHPAWTNIDHYSERYKENYVHLDIDLFTCASWPIDDRSALVVYSSHTVEHISMKAAEKMFEESYRILRPGGFFRVTTPNAPLFWETLNGDKSIWWYLYNNKEYVDSHSPKELLIDYFASQISLDKELMKKVVDDPRSDGTMEDVLDFYISFCTPQLQAKYPEGHMNWWSTEKLIAMMKKVGFEDAYASQFGQSRCAVMKNTTYFDNTHPHISLYVEAKKD